MAHTLLDDQALAWLVRLNSGHLAEHEQQEFWDWLQTSAAHQAAYIRAETLWQKADIVATLKTTQPVTSAFTLWPNWALACGILVMVMAASFFALHTSATHYQLATAVGEQRQVTLEDGTRVILNTNSQLDVTYTGTQRVATLTRGEVYFDVQANPQRPFDVLTRFGMVRVLGTHFSVNQQPDDATITVAEGRVALGKLPGDTGAFAALIELQTNQQLSLQQAYAGEAPVALNAKSALAWRDRQLVFQKQKLARVVNELNRYFNSKITLADPSLEDLEITAVIQLSDLNTTLSALCQPLQLRAQFDADGRAVQLIALPR